MVELRRFLVLVHVAVFIYYVLNLALMVLRDLKVVRVVRSVLIERRCVVTTILVRSVAHSVPKNWFYEVLNLNIGVMVLLVVDIILMLRRVDNSVSFWVETFSPVIAINEGRVVVIFTVDVACFTTMEGLRAMLRGRLLDNKMHRVRQVIIDFVAELVLKWQIVVLM